MDPMIGRMISPDPIVPDALNGQAWNRYSYVGNDPLTFTDPSGHSWFSDIFRGISNFFKSIVNVLKTVLNMVVRFVVQAVLTVALAFTGPLAPFIAAAIAAAVVTGMNGGKLGDMLRSAAVAGATAFAFSVVGDATAAVARTSGFEAAYAFNVAGHAGVGCVSSVASGGSCQSGALSGGVSAAAGPLLPNDLVGGTVARGVVGGLASVAGGGKFENGAVTAAFGYLFNHYLHKDAVARLYRLARGGHHPFAQQWANEYRELISEDALAVLGGKTIGGHVVWEGDHPNKWGPEHKAYNDVGGRKIVDDFIAEKGITPTNQLNVKQSYELIDRLERHDFNVKVQEYVGSQEMKGRINMNRVFRSRGGTGQPGD